LKVLSLFALVAVSQVRASEETGATFEDAIAGKAALVKFLAPW